MTPTLISNDYFTFDIWGQGWANVTISDGTLKYSARVTNVAPNDAFDETISACIALVRGEPLAAVSYFDEPGEHRMRLARTDKNLHISVIWFPDDTPYETNGKWFHDNDKWVWIDEPPWPQCKSVFNAVIPMLPFVTAVSESLHNCYQSLGSATYQRFWSNDDPRQRLDELKTLLERVG